MQLVTSGAAELPPPGICVSVGMIGLAGEWLVCVGIIRVKGGDRNGHRDTRIEAYAPKVRMATLIKSFKELWATCAL